MGTEPSRGLNPRALCAMVLLFGGVVLALSGLWQCYVRGACQVRQMHLAAALLFVSAAGWHVSFNWRPLTRYLLAREGAGSVRLEARVALVLTVLAVLAGLLWAPGRGR